jgi:hypothetical protein
MSIRFHAGYWTIFIAGKPVMSFASKAEAQAMLNVSTEARLLYLLLWTVADDHGKFRGAAHFLASSLFPDDVDSQKRIPENLQALEAAGYIRQKFSDRGACIAIPQCRSL